MLVKHFFTMVKCKNKLNDLQIQFLILFSLVTLNFGDLSYSIDYYYLKVNIIVNNLTACLIFIKYYIYDFSDCLGKIFFRVLFFYSNLYECFLISIHFCLACKLVSILVCLYIFHHVCHIFNKNFITCFTKKKWQNLKIVPWFFQNPFGEN